MRSFFNNNKHDFEEVSDVVLTIPDQSLTVRDILHNFIRGGMEIPPIETGNDDTFESPVDRFDDIVDALSVRDNSIESYQFAKQAKRQKKSQTLKEDNTSGLEGSEANERPEG